MRISRFYILIAVVLLLAGISVTLRAQDQKSADQEERAKAVNVVRLINTAEVWYNMGTKKDASDAHGRFAAWDELYKSGIVKTVQDHGTMFASVQVAPGPEVIPGYRLDLLVSPDGKSFSVALHDTRDGDGLFSVFSDQNGIIFLGSPLQ
jgi:hypothetical protein